MGKWILLVMVLNLAQILLAQEKRALIIGIDTYNPLPNEKITSGYRSTFSDLEGCKNDALSIKSIITSRYGFDEKNIDSLFNEKATRDNILNAIQRLLANSGANDVAFIYYAGHGSQVRNSSSKETDKKDETIVPGDTWKEGISDIRDKQLAALFNSFIDKGIKLTVIMDCCHSGSISRGNTGINPPRIRYMPEATNYDAKDSSSPVPPETRNNGNFLIMTAAQDVELASEQVDENNVPHGAFTLALIEAINQQSVDASAMNLFSAARAILKSNGKKQEPVLGGGTDRQNETLFGIQRGLLQDKVLIAVLDKTGNRITMQGGFALSLYKDNELIKIINNDTIVLKIDSVLGINRSWASVKKGDINLIKAGQLFEVSNWVSGNAPLLKLYISSASFTYAQIEKFAGINNELRKQLHSAWINDLEKTDPYTTIFFINDAWYANIDGHITPVKNFTKNAVLSNIKKDSTLFVEIPPSKGLVSALRNSLEKNPSIKLVSNINDANYMLYGTIDGNGRPSYGLRRVQTAAKDSLESMPLQTKAFGLTEDSNSIEVVTDSVYEYAMRLSKIRGWMQLVTPSPGISNFPFHLEIVNSATDKKIDTLEYKVGEQMSLHLAANENATTVFIPKKYVYVFVIDRSGNMLAAYPNSAGGNVDNRFPKYEGGNLIEDFTLFDYNVTEPAGTDNFFLLASEEPISNYVMVFNQAGVRGIERNATNPLINLLNLGNEEGTRGFTESPANWCLLKLSVKSMH